MRSDIGLTNFENTVGPTCVTIGLDSEVDARAADAKNRRKALPEIHSPAVEISGALEIAGGNLELLQRIFDAFLKDIPNRISALELALSTGDHVTAEREAHSIKGAAANISATYLYSSASEMERACNAGNFELATKIMSPLVNAVARVVPELAVYVKDEATVLIALNR